MELLKQGNAGMLLVRPCGSWKGTWHISHAGVSRSGAASRASSTTTEDSSLPDIESFLEQAWFAKGLDHMVAEVGRGSLQAQQTNHS